MTAQPRIIDLTKTLDSSLEIYTDGNYQDPPLTCRDWCSVRDQGYWVSRLELGTQTGTHIDAPAHFIDGAATLDVLCAEHLLGRYFLVELQGDVTEDQILERLEHFNCQTILFLRTSGGRAARITKTSLELLIRLAPLLWVVAGDLQIIGHPPLEFHRAIAGAGKYLVENLDTKAAQQAPKDGELIALPLRLVGTSGAPCRVIVRTGCQ